MSDMSPAEDTTNMAVTFLPMTSSYLDEEDGDGTLPCLVIGGVQVYAYFEGGRLRISIDTDTADEASRNRYGYVPWQLTYNGEHQAAEGVPILTRTPALRWESAGTDEPGDQNADSRHGPHAFWSLGPGTGGRWVVDLVQRDEDLDEIPGQSRQLGEYPSEQHAKAAAEEAERDDTHNPGWHTARRYAADMAAGPFIEGTPSVAEGGLRSGQHRHEHPHDHGDYSDVQ